MIDSAQLTTLAAILRHGSFDAAANDLGVTQSAVSQRIRALEEHLGTTLIHRGPPCTPTEPGARLYAHAQAIAAMERALAKDLTGLTPDRAPLAIALNADSLATWFPAALEGADAEAPGTLYDLRIDDQDHSADWLRRGAVLAAVSAHGGPIRGCDSRALGALRHRATASPAFAARHFRDGVTAEALGSAPALVFDEKDKLQASWAARMAGRPVRVPAHRLPSTTAFVEMAVRGLGWGMNPASLVDPLIASGALIDLSPDAPFDTPLFWHVSRAASAALAPLTRSIRAAAGTTLTSGTP